MPCLVLGLFRNGQRVSDLGASACRRHHPQDMVFYKHSMPRGLKLSATQFFCVMALL